jgi:hypothetical protein
MTERGGTLSRRIFSDTWVFRLARRGYGWVGKANTGNKNNMILTETLSKLQLYRSSTISTLQLPNGWVRREGYDGPKLDKIFLKKNSYYRFGRNGSKTYIYCFFSYLLTSQVLCLFFYIT